MIKVRDEAFYYYFYFMEERMNIFWSKYEGSSYPWTEDTILRKNKFTNVYRATDRVSQYLIQNVIYNNDLNSFSEEDILLRILIFKVFNKIETWEFIESQVGTLTLKSFNVDLITDLLSERIQIHPIFSSAYLMTGFHRDYLDFNSKHERWLRMIDREFIKNRFFEKIVKAKSLEEVFRNLSAQPFIGDFLAYQYAIDFNYSPVHNFSEDSFVKAGIGAIRGIKKCFIDFGGCSYDDLIRYTQDNLELFREKYGFHKFRNLFGRDPTLIDIQNCFCETDKYLRAKIPDLLVDNTRIKQKYTYPKSYIEFFFPPKWNINYLLPNPCLSQNTMELTLF